MSKPRLAVQLNHDNTIVFLLKEGERRKGRVEIHRIDKGADPGMAVIDALEVVGKHLGFDVLEAEVLCSA